MHRLKYILFIFLLIPFSKAAAFEVNKTNSGLDIKWSVPNETYYINEAGGPAGSLAAIQAGTQTWADVSTSSFTFIYGGTTTSTAYGINDGINIILFGSMGTTGTLARNYIWYNPATGEISDTDIKFNTDYPWATDGSVTAYDVQNVATHELGHSLSLSDLYNDSEIEETMYGYSYKGETKQRTLTQDDINGITYLYASSVDTTPPTGSVSISNGSAYTKSTSVTLTLSASDSSGVYQMCISNATTCSSWETYAATKSWILSSGDGTKTVYVWFKDNAGNANASSFSSTIMLDTTTPVNGTLSASAGTSQILLSWSGFSDAASGIQSYKVVYTTTASPASCSSGTQIYSGSATSYNHTGLTNGSKYYYRVCAIDTAGNTSTGAIATAVTQSQAIAKIPLPTTQQTFTYLPVAASITNADPSLAKPIGLGSVATNGFTVTLQTAAAEFAGKVDVYFALYAPSIDSNNIYILKPDYTFQPLTADADLVPWKTKITGPFDENLFGDIPTVFLTGTYYFGLLVSPEGSGVSGSYYFWITSFEVKSP